MQKVRRVYLHIYKPSPWFIMGGEPFNKAGIAVTAGMLAPDIRVDDIVMYL
jgi:hypothetical protein